MTAHTMARRASSAERRFYTGMALALFVTVWVGFSRSFFMRPLFPDWVSPTEPVIYAHGALFAAWFVLLIVQPSLVAAGRTDLHRALGRFGVALAAAMVIFGTWAALTAATRETGFFRIPVPPLKFLAIPLIDMVVFPILVGLAVAKRREPQSHKRVDADRLDQPARGRRRALAGTSSTARRRCCFFGLTDLFLVPLAIWDLRSRGRLHPVTMWGGALLIGSQVFRVWLLGTSAWDRFAAWAVATRGVGSTCGRCHEQTLALCGHRVGARLARPPCVERRHVRVRRHGRSHESRGRGTRRDQGLPGRAHAMGQFAACRGGDRATGLSTGYRAAGHQPGHQVRYEQGHGRDGRHLPHDDHGGDELHERGRRPARARACGRMSRSTEREHESVRGRHATLADYAREEIAAYEAEAAYVHAALVNLQANCQLQIDFESRIRGTTEATDSTAKSELDASISAPDHQPSVSYRGQGQLKYETKDVGPPKVVGDRMLKKLASPICYGASEGSGDTSLDVIDGELWRSNVPPYEPRLNLTLQRGRNRRDVQHQGAAPVPAEPEADEEAVLERSLHPGQDRDDRAKSHPDRRLDIQSAAGGVRREGHQFRPAARLQRCRGRLPHTDRSGPAARRRRS